MSTTPVEFRVQSAPLHGVHVSDALHGREVADASVARASEYFFVCKSLGIRLYGVSIKR